MAKTFTGNTRTQDGRYTSGIILGAAFWTSGKRVKGIYVRSFVANYGDGETGEIHEFLATEPVHAKINEKNRVVAENGENSRDVVCEKFSIGGLTGIQVALQDMVAAGFEGFHYRDRVEIECTGISSVEGFQNPSPDFKIYVERD